MAVLPKDPCMGSGGFIVLDEDQCVVKNTSHSRGFTAMKAADNVLPAAKERDGWKKY